MVLAPGTRVRVLRVPAVDGRVAFELDGAAGCVGRVVRQLAYPNGLVLVDLGTVRFWSLPSDLEPFG